MKRGLLQGSVLSPVLYNVFMDDVMKKLRQVGKAESPELHLGQKYISSCWYAGEACLLANSLENAQKLLNIVAKHSRENEYTFAVNKCRVIGGGTDDTAPTLYLNGRPIPRAEEGRFIYLGIPITAAGIDIPYHTERMASKALAACHIFRTLGVNGFGFPPSTCRRIYLTFIRPVLEYGLALSLPHKNHQHACVLKNLEHTQRKILKIIQSLRPTISTNAVLLLLGVDTMEERMYHLNLQMYSRFQDAPETFLVHHLLKDERRRSANTRARSDRNRPTPNGLLEMYANTNPLINLQNNLDSDNDEALETATTGRRFTIGQYRGLRLKRRQCLAEIQYDKRTGEAGNIIANMLPVSLKPLPLIEPPLLSISREQRRRIILWRVGGLIGKPEECRRCREGLATRRHIVPVFRLRHESSRRIP